MTYYISKFDECEHGDCLSYDSQKLCNNYHSDLNYYSGMTKNYNSMLISKYNCVHV